MGWQRDAGVGCGLINREVGVYDGPCRFEHVGHGGKPWLVGWDGGECEREAGGVGFTRKAGCCKL
jgi:hypothetical protein